ncbi:hypothetical protein KSP40_PGU004248 [Platanthera guangdongensis]|uniref:Nuclear condensin complex subunit 3 C-terminal domain-containing protein n=1 Tax=Platanthera guangdongensis TaxID=2320717 RepID=A0ABR2LCD3_9ASPA
MAEVHRLSQQIAQILDECRLSHAVHSRKLKELAALRSTGPPNCFFPSFSSAIIPLFDFSRRTPSSERAVRFIAAFAARRDPRHAAACDAFLEEFLRFLLTGAQAAHRTARFRSCHIISEIIMRLPDDAEVSDEVWDEVIESMKHRLEDKVPAIRGFAVCALSRFASDAENSNIVDLFLKNLSQEQNSDVRKLIVLSFPPSNITSSSIVQSTLDVCESVRKAAYYVLGSKFPLQSLSYTCNAIPFEFHLVSITSIKLRTAILQRGLSDRSPPVMKECLKMLKEEWLTKCCNQDPLVLLRYLDVETYESVGEAVMDALLKDGMIHVKEGQSIRQHLSKSEGCDGNCTNDIQLMEAEVSLYWRILCAHLHNEAQVKGSDAANTTGTEAAVYASEASEKNDLLETVLPETISDYVDLVRAHLSAGPTYRFVSRQLLLLGRMLDFSDSTNRKVASSFVRELLLRPLECDVDDDGNKIFMGDGISLGGDRNWARAVAELARKVYSASREFEAEVSCVLKELAQPCRERIADFMQWMHCLAVTALLLENIESVQNLRGEAIEPSELLHSVLLPGVKQVHLDVQRAATRCLCLFGLLERRPSKDIVNQLRQLFINGPTPVRAMVTKALVDLATWHGPEEIDRALELDPEQLMSATTECSTVDLLNSENIASTGVINLLQTALERDHLWSSSYSDHDTFVRTALVRIFPPNFQISENPQEVLYKSPVSPLATIICLRFVFTFKDKGSARQRSYVIGYHLWSQVIKIKEYKNNRHRKVEAQLSECQARVSNNIEKIPHNLMGNKRKKRIFLAAVFHVVRYQNVLTIKEHRSEYMRKGKIHERQDIPSLEIEETEELLYTCATKEVVNYPEKKSSAGKSYMAALCRISVLIQFKSEDQEAIKCMRGLIHGMISAIPTDKDLVKELSLMAARLRSLDLNPDLEIPQNHAAAIFEKLEIDGNFQFDPPTLPPFTPAQAQARTAPARRRVRRVAFSDDDDDAPAFSEVPITPSVASRRSQRASKTAAMSKMSARSNVGFSDEEDGDGSELTSDGDSDSDGSL